MLVQAVAAEHVAAVPRDHVHRVFHVDTFDFQVRRIGDELIDRPDQPLPGVDQVRERVLHGPATRSAREA